MEKPMIAEQKKFRSLEGFIHGSNNFYLHFVNDCDVGEIYRQHAYFKRFQKAHPELEMNVTHLTTQVVRAKTPMPYQKLWEAYKQMAPLVYVHDKYVTRGGSSDSFILCR